MSRTYKDRPYRVKVNEDGNYRNATHNHDRFGEVVEKKHTVKDSDGNVIYDQVPVIQKVRHAINSVPKFITKTEEVKLSQDSSLRYIEGLQPFVRREINPLYQHIFDLYAAGDLDREVQVDTRLVPRKVVSKRFAVKDHCTVNEEWDGHWHGDQPCHKGLPDGYALPRYYNRWDHSSRKAAKSHVRNSAKRSGKRMADAHNVGVDVDDLDKDNNAMAENEHRLAW